VLSTNHYPIRKILFVNFKFSQRTPLARLVSVFSTHTQYIVLSCSIYVFFVLLHSIYSLSIHMMESDRTSIGVLTFSSLTQVHLIKDDALSCKY